MDPAGMALERDLIARNIRTARRHQGLSQMELAKRSGVDLASVYRAERGVNTRSGTLKKIATGLNILFEDLLISKQLKDESLPYAVHRAANATWFACEDKRHRIPEDHEERTQDPAERHRLGALGFVPWFMCPPTIIPENGPGIVLLEVFSYRTEALNAEFYEDGALYLLRGGAVVTIDDSSVELEEGDWVAYKTCRLEGITVLPPHESAALIWVGATRVKHGRA